MEYFIKKNFGIAKNVLRSVGNYGLPNGFTKERKKKEAIGLRNVQKRLMVV
jgi:hypothetical protein